MKTINLLKNIIIFISTQQFKKIKISTRTFYNDDNNNNNK